MTNEASGRRGILIKLDVYLFKIEYYLALIGGISVFLLLALAVVSVSGRNIFHSPLPGYIDWIEQIMPLIAFLGVSYTLRSGSHIRMDILIRNLSKRSLWATELFTSVLILLFILLMLWGSFAHFLRSFDFSLPLWSRDSSMDIALPIWPAKLIVPVAFSVLSIRLFLQLFGYIIAIFNNSTFAVGVAEIEDISKQANKEAALVSD